MSQSVDISTEAAPRRGVVVDPQGGRRRDRQRRIRRRRIGDAAVITLPAADGGRRRVKRLWAEAAKAAEGRPSVVLDLSNFPQLDRLNVASLVRCIRRCQSRGARVALCRVSGPALVVLELNGVCHLAVVSDTPATAAGILHSAAEDDDV